MNLAAFNLFTVCCEQVYLSEIDISFDRPSHLCCVVRLQNLFVRASVLLLVSTFMRICRFPVSLCWLLVLILCKVVKEDKGFFLEIYSCSLAKSEVTWSFLSIALCSYSFRFPIWYLLMCVWHQIAYSCWSLQVSI